MNYDFYVEGEILGKERPRVNMYTGNIYTPNKTKDYERYICECFCLKYPQYIPIENRVSIEIKAYFATPKSMNKTEKEQAMQGFISPTKKPDIDNIAKVVLDALNKVAFKDDNLVSRINVEKIYKETPGIDVKILEY